MDRRVFLQTAAGAALTPALASAVDPVYVLDLSVCRPASALSRTPRRGRWRLLDYESDRGKGVMLVAGQNTRAPEVTLPLNRKGWYAIWFGLRSQYGESRIEARLKSDSTFSLITHHDLIGQRIERRDMELRSTSFTSGPRIDDLFWKYAELTGEEVVLRQVSVENVSQNVWLAYVKLVPLGDEQVRESEPGRAGKTTRRLFAHNDAFGYTSWLRPTTEAEIRRELEPYRDTDFSRIYWEAGMGDRMYYPTRIGLAATDDWIEDPFRTRDRLSAESYREFRKRGIDPFRVAADYAHRIGLEFHAAYRVAGFHFPPPEEEWNSGGLYDQHPEWRGRDRQGRRTPRLSYAYPGVRRFVLSLLREIAAYPIDGLCLLYNRRPPLVEYEPPVVESFRKMYGKDPRRIDDRDPQWLAHRAEILTGFMREVRQAFPKLEITAVVMGTPEENLYNAMDLEGWVRQDLVDTLIPYSSGPTLNSNLDSFTDPAQAEWFLRVTRGSRCKLALNLMPRQITPEEYRRRAHGLYQAGVEHLFFWDCYQRCDFSPSWTALRRLGHREELAEWVRSGSPKIERPGSRLTRLGDWDLAYATPG
jgi:hypothetical protein